MLYGLGVSVLLYDHAGHSFTYELSMELSSRGVPVSYAYTSGLTSPHGSFKATANMTVVPVGVGRTFDRYRVSKRIMNECRLGLDAVRLARRLRVSHIITCNMPVLVLTILAASCAITGRRLTIWFQDSQAGIAAGILRNAVAPRLLAMLEGWSLRRANRVIAISPAMVNEARQMGVSKEKVRLLRNWAPLSAIPTVGKVNPWSLAHGLDETFVYLYSGTLGLKHSPQLLISLSRWIQASGVDATVVVVSEGDVAEQLQATSQAEDLPLKVYPFQPAARLPEVLGASDVCVVLLEPHASEFSVPSKVWSYMCAGRPILGAMPSRNDASLIVAEEAHCGLVVSGPESESRFLAAASVLLTNSDLRGELSRRARAEAENRFNVGKTTRDFAIAADLELPTTASGSVT